MADEPTGSARDRLACVGWGIVGLLFLIVALPFYLLARVLLLPLKGLENLGRSFRDEVIRDATSARLAEGEGAS